MLRLAWLAAFSALMILALNTSSQLELLPANIVAVAAAAGIAVLGYVLNAIGNQSKNLDHLRDFSPYGWAYHHTPLASGADWGGLALLYGFSILFIVVAVVALRRRDISA
ncbi:hypothetical protein AAFM46_11110 [Arthrobacter sp. TMP15]|uniref:hypothetical protein n=1 Tax=Arthrobacter sp. TMP15 TaxID=3140789 RepID=UPI0031BB583C